MSDVFELAREQEENLIGALLKDPSQLEVVDAFLTPDQFHIQALGSVYSAMQTLKANGLGIDSVTVGDELERHGKMQDFWIGNKQGRIALSDLRTNFRGDHARSYAVKILDYAAKRQMIEEFNTGATWAYNGREASEIRDDMIRRLTDIKVPNTNLNNHTQTLKQALSQNYDEVNNGNVKFVPTGLIDLDRALDNGMYAPDFMIIAGRPGQGKTALLLTIAMNAAKHDKRVVFFSLEMSNSQIVMRAISSATGIPFGVMRARKMNMEQKQQYNQAIEDLEHLPLHLIDLPAITIKAMRQSLSEICAIEGGVDLMIVDYLQLQGTDGKFGTRQEEVSSISRGLKGIAKEFGIPVTAAAQLSRAIEQRAEKKPILSDLRESGSMEQDSDIVAFLHSPDPIRPTDIDLIIAKHRNGAVGTVSLLFDKARTRFESAVSRSFSIAVDERQYK